MLSQIRKYCTKALEKMFEEEEQETRSNRIESARISATRLQALDRIRDKKVIANQEGDTTQTTKLESQPIEEVYEDIDDLIDRLTEDTIEEEAISSSAE
ncbi:MAG: hypothetical protein K2Z81_15525 [Cyanobacteria bacterium]|nr:hypothetical protein [Cyanobacteriota bacterium]